MSSLLLSVKSLRVFTGELHPTTLNIYDDYMVYVKRGIIVRNETTISYNHVSQVFLHKGYIASSLEIINTGGVENIVINWLQQNQAKKAKKLIDEKIFHTHAKISGKHIELDKTVPVIEKRLARLKELQLKGVISAGEFEKRRKEMLKSV